MKKSNKCEMNDISKVSLFNEDKMAALASSETHRDILGMLEGNFGDPDTRKAIFSSISRMALRHIIRTLPKSINPTGQMYSMVDDVSLKHLRSSDVNGSFRMLVCALRKVDRETVGEVLTQEIIMRLVGMIRTDDPKERMQLSELLISISNCSRCLHAVFLGLTNELVNFIDNNRNHVGLEEALRIIIVIVKKRAIGYEDMVAFHYQIILRMIETRFCGESKEMPKMIRTICINYPKTIPLTIKHLKGTFEKAWSNTKVSIAHIVGDVLRIMCDETYICLEDEICEIIRMSFDSNHYLVIEAMAEMLLLNHWNVSRHKETFVPKVFGSIYRASQKLWRAESVNRVLKILHAILEMDHRLFEKCLKTHNVKKWKDRWEKEKNN
ncbi:Ser/Thr protein phosphatase 2A regulatory subunit beta [Encephalitozoon hellem]|uniref:Ser/Thr protein phosphatase 2A regulatory subunit beta n=1 Tax=Encephalitozoon hellem TaxID=27973 RepID=A0ABY8CLE7_ENCHE|nr:Ser/Thr protein phosphatase 2A regulatory subunit beta [Encephalitozoon hellem]